jgi:environmental stress-induced protein Ves
MPDELKPRLVYAPEVPSQSWRNGGGETRELLVWPEERNTWQVRVSLARIDQDGPFSEFPGVERWFTVIEGAGVQLRFDSRELRLDTHTEPLRFDGGQAPYCKLLDGPTSDLNLMCRGGKGRLQIADSGVAWEPHAEHCGVFTRTAGVWRDEAGTPIALAAKTLLWITSGIQRASFEASAVLAGPVAYWLAFSPGPR